MQKKTLDSLFKFQVKKINILWKDKVLEKDLDAH